MYNQNILSILSSMFAEHICLYKNILYNNSSKYCQTISKILVIKKAMRTISKIPEIERWSLILDFKGVH